MTALVLGPLLRHVADRTATIWVETDRPCEVRVFSEEHGVNASASTFTAHGHHYALVDVEGLEPGATIPYAVALDGERVWPEPGGPFPAPAIRTIDPSGPVRLSFGSCRRSPDRAGLHGLDALSAFAHRLAAPGTEDSAWPDVLLMVGDQIYADELGEEMRAYLAERRAPGTEPEGEVADFEDYTMLYKLAWRDDPAVRWLLSTVPTYTIFDDHDVRDDWNTSYTWRRQMWAKPWWRARITGGIGSYWIYQHLGNLSPEQRAAEPLYAKVLAAAAGGADAAEIIDEFAERADKEPATTRWSYVHDWGGTRLVVVDSRCSRLLTADRRGMLDDDEFQWLDEQCQGGRDHLLIASSLPYLLPRAIHHAEAWNEAMAGGAWGGRAARLGERLRQGADLEHWAAFDASFRAVAEDVVAVARGERGDAPASISFLSGDIHYSYLARVTEPSTGTAITQIVCSPLRNPLVGRFRWANKIACSRAVPGPFRLLARLSKVAPPPLKWRITDGPWFDNAIATVELDGRRCHVRWETPRDATSLTGMGAATIC
ncbi:metallophosphatase [Actinomadura sp. NBRC 104412]|uniref:alkaline phosphatase D family protein n=1 Tax=Actinomadura sp. NBRC 104412 TaxID=3032203 RepID=UPI0024A0EBEA|nr:alkaline phosphatase D family protein [Actinomadura sp. NBRC 104412]GLZ08820.1 metallophosphatase [Actinomadura sp. NBRC 104412]